VALFGFITTGISYNNGLVRGAVWVYNYRDSL